MARKRSTFNDYPEFLITYEVNGEEYRIEVTGARLAVDAYRRCKAYYGNTVRMYKLVITNGEVI